MGIEPTYEAWEASILPLNYARLLLLEVAKSIKNGDICQQNIWNQAVLNSVRHPKQK